MCVVLVVDYYEGESSMNHLCCMFDTRYLVTEEIGFISASPNTSESEFSYPLYSYVPLIKLKGCVSLDPSKISNLDDGVSSWIHDDCGIDCDMAWLIPNFISIIFFYITQHQTVSHVQCFKSPSWPLRDGLDLWPELIYTLSWESQHEEI